MSCELAGMISLVWLRILETIWSMRYRDQTLFILTDMKTMKQKGTISVKIIEFWACPPILERDLYSSSDSACEGIVKLLVMRFCSTIMESRAAVNQRGLST
jgi:hypothetical protein